jgi:signal transduction histidine kinase
VTSEWHVRRADGSRLVAEVTAKRLPDGRIQAFVRDVTERARLQSQLAQAQKMEAIGRLAGGIAHDFDNLLTVINGTAEMTLAEPAGGDLRAELEQIREAGQRAAALTRQLLALSRQQILQPEVLDLNAVVQKLEPMLSRLIGEDITLVLQRDANLGAVKADPSQVEQVVLNLAINARDAMPDGGTLGNDRRARRGCQGRPVTHGNIDRRSDHGHRGHHHDA